MRLFIAIDITDNEEVIGIYKELKKRLAAEKIRWVKPENMHLTLKFLGSTAPEKVDDIKKLMKKVCEGKHLSPLEFSRIGIFGSSYKPRVIWLGFKENKEIAALAQELKSGLVPLGWEYDRQNFVPHLTLGRVTKINSKKYFQSVLDDYKTLNIKPLEIEKITLYQSILGKEGPVYKEIFEVSTGF